MRKYLFDTNFISSFCNDLDSNHKAAKRILLGIKSSDEIIISTVVIAELSAFTENDLFRDLMVEFALEISGKIMAFDESMLDEYMNFTKTLANHFTAIDSIVLFTAFNQNAELITFDKKLKNIYEKISI